MSSALSNAVLSTIVRAIANDPDAAAAAMAVLGRDRSGPHLDDEAIAAVVEGSLDPLLAAHVLVCSDCAARVEALAPLAKVVALSPGLPPIDAPPRAALFASVRLRSDGGVEVLESTGPTSVGAPVELRSGARADAALIVLRDAIEGAAFELGVVREAVNDRVTLVVRWLERALDAALPTPPSAPPSTPLPTPPSTSLPTRHHHAEPLLVRVRAGGRTLAEVGFVDRCAHVPALRADALCIEIRDAARTLGLAWLTVDAPPQGAA